MDVELANCQTHLTFDESRLAKAARAVLTGEGIRRGSLSLAVVDLPQMQALNRRYLNHDWPTDVLSFPFTVEGDCLEGEVVVCADVAAEAAPRYGWSVDDELLLYVVHGVLHLVGYNDHSDADQAAMRRKEQEYLSRLDVRPADDPKHRPFEKGRVASSRRRKDS